jgi:hypothetical protein
MIQFVFFAYVLLRLGGVVKPLVRSQISTPN